MLIRLFYVSTALGPQTTTVTGSILKVAHAWNAQHGITGVLCQGQGVFLQVLEGERDAVTGLFERIAADRRHKNVEMVHRETITQRRYEKWAMAHVQLSDLDPMTNIEWPEFDPYSVTGLLVMARIDELIAVGTVINAPDA
ncbi:BLUF domain-containing protein [Polaromonas sp.]|uniref:BLUF domain-containing protein n=1 Tax=Polaromonas sp. TaxID=1869339 RepID=UPI0013B88B14|nr:BLUF domain-containing protein [Polaromonas sp.]NDP61296.1 BLUF domain-containing protein [Polaromonas sp.]